MHRNSEMLFRKYCLNIFKDNMRVLEIGPGYSPSPYQQSAGNNAIHWETIDINPNAQTTYIASSEYTFPIADNTFDVVLSGQVIEHVREIWVWIKELARVCKSGGFVITINPAKWPYHPAPYDCWRIYPEGMRALYNFAGLEVLLNKREALDRPSKKELFYLPACILRHPRRYIQGFVHGNLWKEWMAEDAVTIGKKL